jgi:hypothetical protein
MKTVIIQIGNTDDKLSQREWASFVDAVRDEIHLNAWEIHFSGFSSSDAPWQNACWVVSMDDDRLFGLKQELCYFAHQYNQESIAWTEGITEFLKG